MPTIIKRGIPPEEMDYTLHCHYCKSEIKFEYKEGRLSQDQRDGNVIMFDCPVCRHTLSANIKGHEHVPY